MIAVESDAVSIQSGFIEDRLTNLKASTDGKESYYSLRLLQSIN